jgi:putative copper resistance protein D
VPDPLLVIARAVHYAALMQFAGLFVFLRLVLEPTLRESRTTDTAALHQRFMAIAWGSVILILLSDAALLALEAAEIGDEPLSAIWQSDLVVTVLNQTRFGQNWEICAGLAGLAVVLLSLPGRSRSPRQVAVLVLAMSMLGGVAWVGHGAATPGSAGNFHLVADVLHLLGVGCWVGGLLPLALTLAAAGRARNATWTSWVIATTKRFSMLGLWSVGAIVATGLINTSFLIAGPASLLDTRYGHWLLAKIVLLLIAVTVAGVNRQYLSPRLASCGQSVIAMRSLQVNSIIELALGGAVLVTVAVLGLLPPAIGPIAGS